MALPQDGVNMNELPKTSTIPTGKELLFIDPTTNEGGVITLEDLTKQILQNLTSQTFALDQGTKTLPAALNELNSNRFFTKLTTMYDNYEAVFKKALDLTTIGTERTFCAGIKSTESYCIVKFYKRSNDAAKMIVFKYNGITIVDGKLTSLFVKSINAE